jgi:hypothetical protein
VTLNMPSFTILIVKKYLPLDICCTEWHSCLTKNVARRGKILLNLLQEAWGHAAGGAVGLGHCATSRKVAVSIPDGVTRIFH